RAAQLGNDVDRPVAARLGHLSFGEMGEMLEDSQIGVDLRRDPGAANLQDHGRAADERRPVYLCDRGGGVGLSLETGKHLERRPTERLFDLRQQVLERHRRHLAVQPAEFLAPLRWKEILSGREYLAELDEGRPEFFKRKSGALLRLEMGDLTGLSPLQHLAGVLDERRDSDATHEVAKPMANE